MVFSVKQYKVFCARSVLDANAYSLIYATPRIFTRKYWHAIVFRETRLYILVHDSAHLRDFQFCHRYLIRNIYANSHFYLFAPKKDGRRVCHSFYTILVFTTSRVEMLSESFFIFLHVGFKRSDIYTTILLYESIEGTYSELCTFCISLI